MGAAEIVDLLRLTPHPEGGWYRETFRDAGDGRAASTAIYFLLEAAQVSRWHRVDAAEVWHHYAGAPLKLQIACEGPAESIILGPDLANAQRPQAVVPKGHWQAAQSLGEWTLVGCTVAPGFEFSAFEMAPDGWHPA